MKLLDVDWRLSIDLLPKWDALTIEQRRFLIDLSSTTYGTRSADDELIDRVWLERASSRSGRRYRVPRSHRFWLKLVRELSRATPLFEVAVNRDAGAVALENYLLRHYRAQEIERLDGRRPYGARQRLARDLRGEDWWRQFPGLERRAGPALGIGLTPIQPLAGGVSACGHHRTGDDPGGGRTRRPGRDYRPAHESRHGLAPRHAGSRAGVRDPRGAAPDRPRRSHAAVHLHLAADPPAPATRHAPRRSRPRRSAATMCSAGHS